MEQQICVSFFFDEMNIRSSFLQGIISNVIGKVVSKKMGFTPDIHFNDPIQMSFDGDKARVHLSVDVEMNKEDLEGLLKKVL